MFRVALIVGHHPDSPGAYSVCGFSEFEFWNEFVDHVIKEYDGPHTLIKVQRDSYSMPVRQVNTLGPDFFVSFHFNSAASPAATGTEVLHYPSPKSTEIAEIFAEAIGQVLLLPLRHGSGLLPRTAEDRGGALLEKTRMPGVLLEPFFGSNRGDCEQAEAMYFELIDAVCQAIDDSARAVAT